MTAKHFVNKAPFDPNATDVLTPEQERYYMGDAVATYVVETWVKID